MIFARVSIADASITTLTSEFLSSLLGIGDAAGAIRASVIGALLAGTMCAVLGSFITLRRMALFGDMIGHAVLPGVAIGFIVVGHKSTPALLLGALVAGLLAAGLTKAICAYSRLKEDAALGITLSTFYAVGVWLLSWITGPHNPRLSAKASGLNYYLFGNPAVIQTADLVFLSIGAVVVLLVVVVFYKELLACTFDPSFAATIGLPRRLTDGALLVLLTLAIVVSIKILGVILVAALLVIPPATAYLLTERLRTMILCATGVGAVSGLLGAYLDFVFNSGVGPSIVCVAFTFLLIAFLCGPRHGILARWLRHRSLASRTVRENVLASVYRAQEKDGSHGQAIDLARLAEARKEKISTTRSLAAGLNRCNWGGIVGQCLVLTEEGKRRAHQIVRSHRLWELFLQREASLAPDHVHAGAEEVEHFLGEEAVAELESLLDFPDTDPHGRTIPGSTR